MYIPLVTTVLAGKITLGGVSFLVGLGRSSGSLLDSLGDLRNMLESIRTLRGLELIFALAFDLISKSVVYFHNKMGCRYQNNS